MVKEIISFWIEKFVVEIIQGVLVIWKLFGIWVVFFKIVMFLVIDGCIVFNVVEMFGMEKVKVDVKIYVFEMIKIFVGFVQVFVQELEFNEFIRVEFLDLNVDFIFGKISSFFCDQCDISRDFLGFVVDIVVVFFFIVKIFISIQDIVEIFMFLFN